VKVLLYGLGCVLLLGSAVVMASLPYLAPSLWAFVVAGGVFSLLMTGGWLLLTLYAGTWPRPRVGPVLVVGGLIGIAYFLWVGNWPGVAWDVLGLLVGIPLWLSWRRSGEAQAGREPDAVRPPLGR
jgi:hypothetical protein